MYRVIMVPVDGSAFSREAVFQGLRLAKKNGAQLRLVRVGSMPVVFGGPDAVSLQNTAWKAERETILRQLYQLAAECRSSAGVEVTATVEDGPVADALRGHALRHNVNLIVMGTHARRGLARMWLGSIADRLIRETGLPVLVARPPSLATEMNSGPCFKQIVIALDGSALAERSLRPALALAEVEQADVTLLRIVPEERNIPVGEIHSSIGPARARDVQDAQWYLSGVRILLAQWHLSVHSKVIVAGDVPSAILTHAESHDADLIAIATHGRGGLARAMIGSVADRLVSDGMISVLAIHPEEHAAEGLVVEQRPMFAEAMPT
jgi:nucleotide-binding universal stress UspA family protein